MWYHEEQSRRAHPSSERGKLDMKKKKEIPLLTRMVNYLQDEEKAAKCPPSSSKQQSSRLFFGQSKFVGREKQLKTLHAVYERISTGGHSEIVLIHGPSGAGKSTLLESLVRELPSKLFFVSGKFDQLQSHAPYAALVSASDQLCRQVLRRQECYDIRDRLRELLGPEINLLGSLIPTIAKMTAADGDTADDEPKEGGSRRGSATMGGNGFTRFKLLFRAFLRCVASRKNPVVLFLDDIQWADEASLQVLKALVTDSLSKHIMIIGAYRENQMDNAILRKYNLSNECTNSDVDDASTASSSSIHRAQVTDIAVAGLSVESLNDIISSVLEMEKSDTMPLSTLVLNKTDGNPFYALNFLDMLLSKRLLLKAGDGSWAWDNQQILQQTNVSDNLATILEAKLRELPDKVRSILQMASFIGHTFTTEVLVTIVYEEQDMIETEYNFQKHPIKVIYDRILTALKVAVGEGLLETTTQVDEYKFSHDKIQQCLYMDLIPDDVERGLLHQRIGTLIWSSVKSKDVSESGDWVFLAAENLNRALNLVDYSGTRYELIEVNVRAAKLAMERSAFIVASEYLRTAVSLLEGDASWNTHHELCIDLYCTSAEAEKNVACYERSRELVAEIHVRAKSLQHQFEAYSIEIQSLAVQGDLEGSVILGLAVLRQVGVKFPKRITMAVIVKELVLAKIAIGRRSMDDLLELPAMTDEKKLLALNLMNIVCVNAFVLGDSYKNTFAAVCIRMVRLSLKYGSSPMASPVAFAGWGVLHTSLGYFDVAVDAEKLSMDMVDKFDATQVRGRTVIINYSVCHLARSKLDREVCQEFLQAYHLSMSFGDISFGYYGFVGWLYTSIYLDIPLEEIHNRTRSVVSEGREYESSTLLMFILPMWQLSLILSGDSENPDPRTLLGEAYDDDFSMEMKAIGSKMAFYGLHNCQMMLGYTYEAWDAVQEMLPVCRKTEKEAGGYFTMGFNSTLSAVCNYDLYRAHGKRKNKRAARRAHRIVQQWSTTGTVMLSGANKWLTAMEGLCVTNIGMDAVVKLFEDAFVALSENNNTYFEALANERLARLFLDEGTPDPTKGWKYLSRAIHLYRQWGALAKVTWLEQRFSQSAKIAEGPFP